MNLQHINSILDPPPCPILRLFFLLFRPQETSYIFEIETFDFELESSPNASPCDPIEKIYHEEDERTQDYDEPDMLD